MDKNISKNKTMKKINLYFGLILFAVFLLSGYYLKAYFKPQHIAYLPLRMEIRANHIYILFLSFLNIISFKCELTQGKKVSSVLDSAFRVLLIVSGMVAIYAFMYDHNGDLIGRKVTLLAAVLSLSSIVLFLTNELLYKLPITKTKNPH